MLNYRYAYIDHEDILTVIKILCMFLVSITCKTHYYFCQNKALKYTLQIVLIRNRFSALACKRVNVISNSKLPHMRWFKSVLKLGLLH